VIGTAVTLTWSPSTDDVGVSAYDVLRDGVRTGTVTVVGAGTSTSYTDSALAAATTYEYTVVARDAQDNASRPSASARVTTGPACASPVCAVREVVDDSDVPWGLVVLPDGHVLYSRRDAHDVISFDPVTGVTRRIGSVPGVASTDGEGGLMGIAVGPGFTSDRWLYVMHTTPTDARIVRIRYAGGALDPASTQVLVRGILRNKYHNGGRLRFGPDGMLYAATGDAQQGDFAQALTGVGALNGKILRMTPLGQVPGDNPFPGSLVWSYGHRNPQGLAFDGQGRLWEQEFGNSLMDETNLVVKGGNYGWPLCEGHRLGVRRRMRSRRPGRPCEDLRARHRVVQRPRGRRRPAVGRVRPGRQAVPPPDRGCRADRVAGAARRRVRTPAHGRAGGGRGPVADDDQPRRQGQRAEQQC
jgi:glucose/arabinose dehydrogenase